MFRLKNPTTGFVGGYTGIELVERHMNQAADKMDDPVERLFAQLQALTQIVGHLVDDLNPDRSDVLAIVEAYDREHAKEEYTHGKP